MRIQPLPDKHEAAECVVDGNPNAVTRFVLHHQPIDEREAELFRRRFVAAINHAVENGVIYTVE